MDKPAQAGALKELLQERAGEISGAGKGASYVEWDPENDKYITYHYDAKSPERKAENKGELQNDFNLEQNTELPLLGMIGDLSEASGFPVFLEAIGDLLKKDLQVVVMPQGPTVFVDAMETLEAEFSGRFKMVEKYDKKLAHRIMAAADMMLIPSVSGMSGENHLIGLRYGTLPVLINSGDYPDDISDFDPDSASGNGFMFDKLNKSAVEKAVLRALKVYADREGWRRLQETVMMQDHSWNQVSENYLRIYQKAGL